MDHAGKHQILDQPGSVDLDFGHRAPGSRLNSTLIPYINRQMSGRFWFAGSNGRFHFFFRALGWARS